MRETYMSQQYSRKKSSFVWVVYASHLGSGPKRPGFLSNATSYGTTMRFTALHSCTSISTSHLVGCGIL